ncbi:hypothetical protein K491DRAFT_763823 [Lophiostoma macrostomum CBS 122681]|uniref:Heterokaryon incompatibility domain-containing protein n=1 Tax=Lophiostoma macrostomum CBS 122681 TaxID=1314788 RepID=A0A6A6SIG9_9PLEO|nr:hypothetical protein K491DRAFT_763823 [Lophiostoma macrostomum CBS 122681]
MTQDSSQLSAVSPYRHSYLSPDSRDIRLLTLQSGAFNDEIRCSTRIVSLDIDPVYETISYAWGSPQDTKPIFLDGQEVYVRISLELVLRHLRKPDQSLLLWADAICINQKNVTEKSHQVSMMGEIYSKCQRVYIWLGVPDFPHGDKNQIAVNPFGLAEHFADDKHYSELPGYATSPSGDASFDLENASFQNLWKGLRAALASPWWTRLWCVQEVLLSPKALLLFGHWSISWDRFRSAAFKQGRHQTECCSHLVPLVALQFQFRLDDLVYDARKQPGFPLDSALRRYRYKKCEDPRDKVFALLGVAKMLKAPKLQPDYSCVLQEVLIKAMEAVVLEADGDLACFTGTGFNSYQRELPTWVRDLSLELDGQTIPFEGSRLKTYTLYNSSCHTISRPQRRNRHQLVLQGINVDIVQQVGEPARIEGVAVHDLNTLLKEWHRLVGLDHHNRVSFASNSNQEVFWRTLTGDTSYNNKDRLIRLPTSELKGCEEWASEFPFSAMEMVHSVLHPQFLPALEVAVAGRAMFITQKGRIGLCEPTTKVGDEVWILEGGRVPFILRPLKVHGQDSSPHHALIGDCYLHGVMDGEVFEESRHLVQEVVLD